MNPTHHAREILEIMLQHLGHKVSIEIGEDPESPSLHVRMENPQSLIGSKGEKLEDLQHLMNKLLRQRFSEAPKVRLDVENFRKEEEERFLATIRPIVAEVMRTGVAIELHPMNSYERRLVHQLLKEDVYVRSSSSQDEGRMKRITLSPR